MTYTLDGTTDSLENLIGKSGHLKITVDLTNYETGTVTVNGKERTIVTPLVTAVGVIFGEDASTQTTASLSPPPRATWLPLSASPASRIP